MNSLPIERVLAYPDTEIFLADDTSVGNVLDLANVLIEHSHVREQFASEVLTEHTHAVLEWAPSAHLTKRVYLKKLEPNVLRTISLFRVVAKCSVEMSEFPLRHGQYDGVRVAWAENTLLGNPTMLLATTDATGGLLMSLRKI
jgi:hypothetical protein